MKKQILLLLVIAAVLTSCTKNASDTAPPSNPGKPASTQLYAVNVNLGKFDVDYVERGGKVVAAKDYLKSLSYAFYDSTGNFIKASQFGWQTSMPIPTSISDSLADGKYTVVIIGMDSAFNFAKVPLSELQIRYGDFFNELFLKKIEFKVQGSAVTLNDVILERITGTLQINLTDNITNQQYISATIDSIPSFYNVMWNVSGGQISKSIYSDILSSNALTAGCIGSSRKLRITIYMYDNSKNPRLVAQRVINDVYVYPNKKTILTGKIFTTPQNVSGTVNLETEYKDVINMAF